MNNYETLSQFSKGELIELIEIYSKTAVFSVQVRGRVCPFTPASL